MRVFTRGSARVWAQAGGAAEARAGPLGEAREGEGSRPQNYLVPEEPDPSAPLMQSVPGAPPLPPPLFHTHEYMHNRLLPSNPQQSPALPWWATFSC